MRFSICNCVESSLMRFSCAFTFCCKAAVDGSIERAGAVRLSGGEQGGTDAHPQLSTINTAIPEPYLTQDSRMVCPFVDSSAPPGAGGMRSWWIIGLNGACRTSDGVKVVRTRPLENHHRRLVPSSFWAASSGRGFANRYPWAYSQPSDLRMLRC
jgi:hypothetical protein